MIRVIITRGKEPTVIRMFNIDDRDGIGQYLLRISGGDVCENGVPLFMEAASWCELASVGERFECERFSIEIVER